MIDQLRLEGVGGGALWITQLVDGHRTVLVDTHQQPVQPHHWTCCHPLLDIADQTRDIGEARDVGVEEVGAVCGHGGAGLADEDSTMKKRVVKLPAGGTVLEDGFLDLKLKSPFNGLSLVTLNMSVMHLTNHTEHTLIYSEHTVQVMQ